MANSSDLIQYINNSSKLFCASDALHQDEQIKITTSLNRRGKKWSETEHENMTRNMTPSTRKQTKN